MVMEVMDHVYEKEIEDNRRKHLETPQFPEFEHIPIGHNLLFPI